MVAFLISVVPGNKRGGRKDGPFLISVVPGISVVAFLISLVPGISVVVGKMGHF